MSFRNALRPNYPNRLPVDTRLTPFGNQVRLMTHLHGGFVAADSDGSPAATPLGFGVGETQTVLYTNQAPQVPASLLWFQGHAPGVTRLDVFAGLPRLTSSAISSTRHRAQPDRYSRRSARGPAGHPEQLRRARPEKRAGCDQRKQFCN
jgi:hypothetical protein